jgi:hypothetical protein
MPSPHWRLNPTKPTAAVMSPDRSQKRVSNAAGLLDAPFAGRRAARRAAFRSAGVHAAPRWPSGPRRPHPATIARVVDLELHRVRAEDQVQQPVQGDPGLPADSGHARPVVAAPHEPGDDAANADPEDDPDAIEMADARQRADDVVAEWLDLLRPAVDRRDDVARQALGLAHRVLRGRCVERIGLVGVRDARAVADGPHALAARRHRRLDHRAPGAVDLDAGVLHHGRRLDTAGPHDGARPDELAVADDHATLPDFTNRCRQMNPEAAGRQLAGRVVAHLA